MNTIHESDSLNVNEYENLNNIKNLNDLEGFINNSTWKGRIFTHLGPTYAVSIERFTAKFNELINPISTASPSDVETVNRINETLVKKNSENEIFEKLKASKIAQVHHQLKANSPLVTKRFVPPPPKKSISRGPSRALLKNSKAGSLQEGSKAAKKALLQKFESQFALKAAEGSSQQQKAQELATSITSDLGTLKMFGVLCEKWGKQLPNDLNTGLFSEVWLSVMEKLEPEAKKIKEAGVNDWDREGVAKFSSLLSVLKAEAVINKIISTLPQNELLKNYKTLKSEKENVEPGDYVKKLKINLIQKKINSLIFEKRSSIKEVNRIVAYVKLCKQLGVKPNKEFNEIFDLIKHSNSQLLSVFDKDLANIDIVKEHQNFLEAVTPYRKQIELLKETPKNSAKITELQGKIKDIKKKYSKNIKLIDGIIERYNSLIKSRENMDLFYKATSVRDLQYYEEAFACSKSLNNIVDTDTLALVNKNVKP